MISQKINLYNLYILHIFRKKSYNKSMKKINIKKLLFYILVPLLSGAIVGVLTSGETKNYNGIVPGFVFPIVWSILYIMLGISSYLVKDDEDLLTIYKVNLIINLAWSFIFFTFNMKILAFLWIILLIIITTYMIIKYYKYNKVSAYLLIPYLFWLIFASILNIIEIIK